MRTLEEEFAEAERIFQEGRQDVGAVEAKTTDDKAPETPKKPEVAQPFAEGDIVGFNFKHITDVSIIHDEGLKDCDCCLAGNLESLVGNDFIGKIIDISTGIFPKIKILIPKSFNSKAISNYLTIKVTSISISRSLITRASFATSELLIEKKIAEYKKKLKEESKLTISELRRKEIEELAESIYVDDWSLDELQEGEYCPEGTYDSSSNSKYCLKILFKEIHMTNSEGKERDMKDLYVSLFFDKEFNLSCSNIYGARGLVSYEEFKTQYRHSHLNTNSDWGWSRFCIGGGTTEMSMALFGLSSDLYDIKALEKVFILLFGFVSWESLEGTPYKYIRNISGGGQRSMSIGNNDVGSAYNHFIRLYDNFPVKTNVEHGIVKFKVSEDDPWIVDALKSCTQKTVVKLPNGEISSKETSLGAALEIANFNEDAIMNRKRLKHQIYFKGEWQSTLVLAPENKEVDESVIIPHPDITRGVTKRLEEKLNNFKLKSLKYESSRR